MKSLAEWSGLSLYLGIGIILGCTITLASNWDTAMAVGGLICVVSVGIHTFAKWRLGELFTKHEDLLGK